MEGVFDEGLDVLSCRLIRMNFSDVVSNVRFRRIGLLAVGTLIGQAALFVAMPVLTRLYSPAEFGTYALIVSVIGILAPVSALRFELAIPIPELQVDAWHIFLLCIHATGVLALGLFCLLWLQQQTIAIAIGLPSDQVWLIWVLPAAVFLAGVFQALSYWNVRNEQYTIVAKTRGGQGVAIAMIQMVLGFSSAGTGGLLIGDLLGRAVISGWSVCAMIGSNITCKANYSLHKVIATAARFKGFAIYSSISALVNSVSIYLPMLFVGSLLGAQTAGLLLLAQRIVGLPGLLFSGSISHVFVIEFSKLDSEGERGVLYRQTLGQTALLIGPIFLVIGGLAPWVFAIIFGESWRESGYVASALVSYSFAQLLSGSTISALDVLEAHRTRLIRELIFLIGTIMALFTGYMFELEIVGLSICFSVFGTFFYFTSLIWVHRCIQGEGRV